MPELIDASARCVAAEAGSPAAPQPALTSEPAVTERELALLEALARATRSLSGCREIDELLAEAAEVARRELGFDRAVVLGVSGGQLHARDSGPLSDPESDRLRRQILAAPVTVSVGTPEHAELGGVGGRGRGLMGAHSPLAEALALRAHVLVAVSIDARPVGLLVLDRSAPAVRPGERELALHHATMVGLLLERLLLSARVSDVAAELRRLTTFSNALMRESAEAPLGLPSAREEGVVTLPGVLAHTARPGSAPPRPGTDFKLTQQERRVARLLAAGCSNREIASELVVSTDTVKSHVAHVLAKLGVSNRAQAAVLFANSQLPAA